VTPLRPLEFFYDQEFNLVLTDVFLRNISLHMNGFSNIQPYMWEDIRLMVDDVINPAEYFSQQYKLENIDQVFKNILRKVRQRTKGANPSLKFI